MITRLPALLTLLALTAAPAAADDWPRWRGPTSNGVAPAGEYPVEWSSEKNIAWTVELPGPGGSTPIVTGDKIVLTAPKDGQNAVLCFDRSGKPQWSVSVGKDAGGKHKKGSGSNPSPVTDGEHLFAYFRSGDLAAITLDGKTAWEHNLQQMFAEDTLWWDLGTSPVLTEKHVIVAVVQTGPSYLAAFDKKTGELAWKADRDLGAPEEAAQTYATPIVINDGGEERLIVLGADHVTCHSAADGRELWRVGGLNPTGHKFFRSIASPVVTDGIVIAPYARGDTVTAIRLGGSGDVTKSHILWTESETGADVPTPVAQDGKVYIARDKAEVVCRDAKTGKQIWKQELPKNRNAYSSSPILAGGKLYVTREDATTYVLDAASGEQLAENTLGGEFTVSTPVFVDGQILLRTHEKLYCIGERGSRE
jgi:outer membrane protein assembly factor BamB